MRRRMGRRVFTRIPSIKVHDPRSNEKKAGEADPASAIEETPPKRLYPGSMPIEQMKPVHIHMGFIFSLGNALVCHESPEQVC